MNDEIIKKQKIGHYKDILDCIQDRVNIIAKSYYKDDECFPIYKVSLLWENYETQKIILNCTHLGRTFARVLFPIKDNYWEYDSLGDIVECLYNQTM